MNCQHHYEHIDTKSNEIGQTLTVPDIYLLYSREDAVFLHICGPQQQKFKL